jgi:UDPglucose 6-dehydrogenase
MTITIVGHGYVGLITACVFADFGNKVWVIGHTKEKIEQLKKGNPLIYEPGLTEFLKKNLTVGRLRFSLDYSQSIPESDIVFITVGTPPKKDGEADLSNVISVAEKIAKHLKHSFTVVSCKSTVPVGTNKKIESIIQKNKSVSAQFAVASCPEFLREGTGIQDTVNPDRVIIGSHSQKAIDMLLELHASIGGKRILTNFASAELIKYASNAMLATKISYANLISFYCEKTGADVETVLDAVGMDRRIGRIFLYPGVGYGGSCLPKDVKAFIQTGKNSGINTRFLESVEDVNIQSRKNMIEKILKNIKGKTIGIWGLSFKPDTDDIRFAPSIYIIEELLNHKFKIQVYDQEALSHIKKRFGKNLVYCSNPCEAAQDASALCILTEWNEFKQVDFKQIKKLMKFPMIFDGRNIYDPKAMKKLGIIYFGVGRSL